MKPEAIRPESGLVKIAARVVITIKQRESRLTTDEASWWAC